MLQEKTLKNWPKKLANLALNLLIIPQGKIISCSDSPGWEQTAFWLAKYSDYLIDEDDERKKRYLARAKKIKNKSGEFTWKKPESANYWNTRLLWGAK